jgi:hypothetical protein
MTTLAPDCFITPRHARVAAREAGFQISETGEFAWHPETPGVIWELERRGDFTSADTVRRTAHYVWVILTGGT